MQPEAHPIQPQPLDLVGPQVGLRRQAVEEHTGAAFGRHAPHPGVIVVQDGHPIRRQGFDQFGLAAGDGFLRAGTLRVHRPHQRDHTDHRPGDLAQEGNLARHVEAHFQHRTFVLTCGVQQGERQANLVIQIARIF